MVISTRAKVTNVVIHILLILMTIFMIMPFVLLFISSITSETALVRDGYSFLPKELSLAAYEYIMESSGTIFRAYGMTILITFAGTLLNLLLSAMLAYGLSLNGLPGKKIISFYVFFTMLFNGGLVPTYLMYTQIWHIGNTFWALVIPQFMCSAMNVIIIRTYFQGSIPSALYEACKIDGGGHLTIFRHIVLPLGKPILISMGLFTALTYWNDWTNALYYVGKTKSLWGIMSVLNEMIANMQYLAQNSNVGSNVDMSKMPTTAARMAIAFIGILPLMVIYPFLQKYFAKGISVGAVKG